MRDWQLDLYIGLTGLTPVTLALCLIWALSL